MQQPIAPNGATVNGGNVRRMQQPPSQQPNDRPPGTQVQRATEAPQRRLEINPMLLDDEHWKRLEHLATRAFKAGVLPNSVDSVEKAFIIALKSVGMGLDPLYGMEQMAIINKKPTLSGQAILRLIQERAPKGSKIEVITDPKRDNLEAIVEGRRPGYRPLRVTFSLEDARKAGLDKKPGPWQQYPRVMMRWRAIAEISRILFADIIAGVYLPDEMGATVNEQGEVIDAEFTHEKGAAVSQVAAPSGAPSAAPAQPSAAAPVEIKNIDTAGRASVEQCKQLWRAARAKGWSDTGFRELLVARYEVQSTEQLLTEQWSDALKFVLDNEPAKELRPPPPEVTISPAEEAAAAEVDKL